MALSVKELMWGDWVLHHGNPRQIKGAVDFTFAKDFEPIPLTPENLEKNGFVRNGTFMSMAWNNDNVIYADGSFDNHIDISLAGNDNHSEYVNIRVPFSGLGMPLHYFHELQRALRCCGLWDVAENFKV